MFTLNLLLKLVGNYKTDPLPPAKFFSFFKFFKNYIIYSPKICLGPPPPHSNNRRTPYLPRKKFLDPRICRMSIAC